jgi:Flp pilus assembly protein TadG
MQKKRFSSRFSIISLISSQGGLAMVEFALVAPLLLALIFGVVELTRYIVIFHKVERTTYSISNLVTQYLPAQYPTISPDNEISEGNIRNNAFNNIARMMDPYDDSADLAAIVTSVVRTSSGDKLIRWQIAGGGSLSNGDTKSVVNGLAPSAVSPAVRDTKTAFNADIEAQVVDMQPGENFIVVEVFYNYEPILSDILTRFGSPTLAQTTMISRNFAMPRQGNLLDLPPNFNP